MDFIQKVMAFLQTEHERPTNYGLFHIIFIGITILATVLICVFLRRVSDKKIRIIAAISWALIFVLEIYKQIVFNYSDGKFTEYRWQFFPFQLCSSPLFLLPIVAFVKDCKFRDGAIMFMSTFSFFGGLCVYAFPNDVFDVEWLGVQIQTMIHHGVQIALGIYLFVVYRKKFTLKNSYLPVLYFAALSIIALVLNFVVYEFVPDQTFNMFFLSPYFHCTLPILSEIYPAVPYVVFLLIYLVGFVFCAFIMFAIMFGVEKLAKCISSKSTKKENDEKEDVANN